MGNNVIADVEYQEEIMAFTNQNNDVIAVLRNYNSDNSISFEVSENDYYYNSFKTYLEALSHILEYCI